MKAHERISAAIAAANEEGRPALVPFMTAGYPEPVDFIDTLKAVASAGDVVELGIPFSDPMADGMTIQRSSFEALQKGVSLQWIFDQLEQAGDVGTPLVMMSYLNPLLAFGYDALADDYGDMFEKGIVDAAKVTRSALQHAASIAGMVLTTETLVTDMPEEEKPAVAGGHSHDY